MLIAYFPFANIKSSSFKISWLLSISSLISPIILLSSNSIRSISFFSSLFKLEISLVISTTAIGSIKSVEPVDDWSWIIPLTILLYSFLTGTTYLSFRIVTIASCKYFCMDDELTIEFILFFMELFFTWISLLIFLSWGLASSAISSSLIITEYIFSSISLFVKMPWDKLSNTS